MAKAIGEAAGGMARTLTLPMQQLAMAFSGHPALTDRNLKAKITEQSAESQFAAEERKHQPKHVRTPWTLPWFISSQCWPCSAFAPPKAPPLSLAKIESFRAEFAGFSGSNPL